MNNFSDKIEVVRKTMFEMFPNCHHTIIINLWDDGDYTVTAQHGDNEKIHRFCYYTQDPVVRYTSEPFLTKAIKMDKYGNTYYVPDELIPILNGDTKDNLNIQ